MPTKRAEIVSAALPLFARDGFHATGIDRIVDEAGVSKKTLYSHFRSKDELILAVLESYDSAFRNDFVRRVERSARSPRARLLAIFDVAKDWFTQKQYYGCLFVNAIGEHSEPSSELRQTCQTFKRRMREYIRSLVVDAGIEPVETVTDELALLFEGAIVTSQVAGCPDAARTAKRIAKKVLAAASLQQP